MNRSRPSLATAVLALAVLFPVVPSSHAQPPNAPPPVVSPEVGADRRITFRVLAPKATAVQLASSGDVPGIGFGQSKALERGENGVWSVTVGPVPAGKAKSMVVVMPHGHTGPFRFGMPMLGEFETEFTADIMPQMEKRYRVHTDRASRAMAGLSMGGAHTLNIGIPNLERFAYLGVYSSGIFGIAGGPGGGAPQGPSFEEKHAKILDDARLKEGLKLVWFATGKDDFLIETSRATVAMLRKHQFNVTFKETDGGHTWDKWREYLDEFAPLLFQ